MIDATAAASTSGPSLARWRTTSRSLTMPSMTRPSELTTTAPMLCSASRSTSACTVAAGAMVMTPVPFLRIRSSIFIGEKLPPARGPALGATPWAG